MTERASRLPNAPWLHCLLCGHLLGGHKFNRATMLTVPCAECPNGICREVRSHV